MHTALYCIIMLEPGTLVQLSKKSGGVHQAIGVVIKGHIDGNIDVDSKFVASPGCVTVFFQARNYIIELLFGEMQKLKHAYAP